MRVITIEKQHNSPISGESYQNSSARGIIIDVDDWFFTISNGAAAADTQCFHLQTICSIAVIVVAASELLSSCCKCFHLRNMLQIISPADGIRRFIEISRKDT